MRTREIITSLKAKTNESPEVLLLHLNEVHRYLLSNTGSQSIYYSPGNYGLPPFLTTTNNQYRYTFPTGTYPGVEVLRTIAVTAIGLTDTGSLGDRRGSFSGTSRHYRRNNISYRKIAITSKDKTSKNPAEITFLNRNPGDTTDGFHHHFEFAPVEIVSQQIELAIPEKHHIDVVRGVLALIKDESYGDSSAWEAWLKTGARRIFSDMNKGAQGGSCQTPINPRDRQFVSLRHHG